MLERLHSPEAAATLWSDWLVDAVATSTQDRRYLRGDPEADKVAIDAILLNGRKAILNAIQAYCPPATALTQETSHG